MGVGSSSFCTSLALGLCFTTATFAQPAPAKWKPCALDATPRVIPKEAADRFAKSLQRAEKGSLTAQAGVARAYYSGVGVANDYTRAAEWFLKAAERGDASAQRALSIMYLIGRGVRQDALTAQIWDKKARAQMGGPMPQRAAREPTDEQAFLETKRAADNGDLGAQLYVAGAYYTGRGVAKDAAAAASWFGKAADRGSAEAQYNLGVMYKKGLGVTKDDTTAVRLFARAAENRFERAQFAIALSLSEGTGVARDDVAAVRWYSQLAARGRAVAQYYLGSMIAAGRGVARDPADAYFWLDLAHDRLPISTDLPKTPDQPAQPTSEQARALRDALGSKLSASQLGDVQIRLTAWRAAAMGDAHAQLALAEMFVDGKGFKPSLVEAKRWMMRAVVQEDTPDNQPVPGKLTCSQREAVLSRHAALVQRMTPGQIAEGEELIKYGLPR